jgi:hypothetical protein
VPDLLVLLLRRNEAPLHATRALHRECPD